MIKQNSSEKKDISGTLYVNIHDRPSPVCPPKNSKSAEEIMRSICRIFSAIYVRHKSMLLSENNEKVENLNKIYIQAFSWSNNSGPSYQFWSWKPVRLSDKECYMEHNFRLMVLYITCSRNSKIQLRSSIFYLEDYFESSFLINYKLYTPTQDMFCAPVHLLIKKKYDDLIAVKNYTECGKLCSTDMNCVSFMFVSLNNKRYKQPLRCLLSTKHCYNWRKHAFYLPGQFIYLKTVFCSSLPTSTKNDIKINLVFPYCFFISPKPMNIHESIDYCSNISFKIPEKFYQFFNNIKFQSLFIQERYRFWLFKGKECKIFDMKIMKEQHTSNCNGKEFALCINEIQVVFLKKFP